MSDLATRTTGSSGSAVVDDVAKRARAQHDAEMDMSAMPALGDTSLGVAKALGAANTTLQRNNSEFGRPKFQNFRVHKGDSSH